MSILTFESKNEPLTDCNVVKLGIRLKDGMHTELKLLSVELFVSQLSVQQLTLISIHLLIH